MPNTLAKLLRDPDARHRWVTWRPVVVTLFAIAALVYIGAIQQPQIQADADKAQHKANTASGTANSNRDLLMQQCHDRQQRAAEFNRQVRLPLDAYAKDSAAAWQGVFDLIAKTPSDPKATPAQLRDRARLLALLQKVADAAGTLEKSIKTPKPIVCDV